MIIEYRYYPSNPEAIEQALKVKFQIDYILICIEFRVTKFHSATFDSPEEGGELIVKSQEILYVTTIREPEIPIMINKEQKFVIGDYIDYDRLDRYCKFCWQQAKRTDTLEEVEHD